MPYKIYIDSRFRVDRPGDSDTDFTFEMPHPLNIKGRCLVDLVQIPNTFFCIREDNNKIYVRENTNEYYIRTIAPGQYNAYTLKDAVLAALDLGRSLYRVTYYTTANKVSIPFRQISNSLSILLPG